MDFPIEAETDHKLAFLEVYFDNTGQALITRVFRKKAFIGLFTSFVSFTSLTYKIGLVQTLVDRTLNTWKVFNEDVKALTIILKKNLYPSRLIERIINRSVTKHVISNSERSNVEQTPNTFCFKLPYIGVIPASPKSAFVDYRNFIAIM